MHKQKGNTVEKRRRKKTEEIEKKKHEWAAENHPPIKEISLKDDFHLSDHQ